MKRMSRAEVRQSQREKDAAYVRGFLHETYTDGRPCDCEQCLMLGHIADYIQQGRRRVR